ncbi:hypothetical protein [Filimonas effusa]|uniref:Uncharacterized protein n=1 Tax=Filimonas effusa TaxID=2508721 RepID=A0A4Q1D3R4_9BACT|nr:hypothetical protein [Filimonas effusa]RXK83035.1 hypothetical protein ESB13_12990 [Filimonas effusa]
MSVKTFENDSRNRLMTCAFSPTYSYEKKCIFSLVTGGIGTPGNESLPAGNYFPEIAEKKWNLLF